MKGKIPWHPAGHNADPDNDVVIVTGSPRAQAFPLPERVDTIKLPAATKDDGGGYQARKLRCDLASLVRLRSELLLAAVASYEPDVVLVDMAMPDTSGVEVTRRLCRACPSVKILAMSPHEDGPFPACVLELGAAGYITKGCSPRELVKAVRDVGRGERYVSPEVAQNLILKRAAGNDSRIGMLAPRELEVMLMLSEGRTLREISERLCVSPKTVSTYRTRLMRKLGTSSNVELAHVAFRHGVIQPLPIP